MASYLDLEKFAYLVKNKRGSRGLRETATLTGISAATISRVERGKIPDLVTFPG